MREIEKRIHSFCVLSLITMYHHNLQKISNSTPPTYIIRAGIDTILLSSSENIVFTKARISLPYWSSGTIKGAGFALKGNPNIEVPTAPLKNSDKNLVVQINNLGPLDILIKENDIIAEVVLSPLNTILPFQIRPPDLIDIAIFSKTCEILRLKLIKKRRENPFVSVLQCAPEEDIWDNFLQELGLGEAMTEAYDDALRGQEFPIRDVIIEDAPTQVLPTVQNTTPRIQAVWIAPIYSDSE